MLCCVLSQRSQEDLRAENTGLLHKLEPTALLHRVFVCETPPLNSEDALRKKTSRPRISLMAVRISGRMSRELSIIKACLMFLNSSELS